MFEKWRDFWIGLLCAIMSLSMIAGMIIALITYSSMIS